MTITFAIRDSKTFTPPIEMAGVDATDTLLLLNRGKDAARLTGTWNMDEATTILERITKLRNIEANNALHRVPEGALEARLSAFAELLKAALHVGAPVVFH